MSKLVPIRHIGYLSLCAAKNTQDNIHRVDLGYARYKQMGVRERFKDEKPYRVCKRCLAVIHRRESSWRKAFKKSARRADTTAKGKS